MGFSESILAAMIGATATVATALFQIVMSWRASSGDRRKRSGFRGLLWTFALMGASFVGGFAFSEYRAQASRDDTRALRAELNQQLQTLASSAARLEQVRLSGPLPTEARTIEERRRGGEGVPAIVHIPACRGQAVAFSNQRAPCAEAQAQRVAVCAVLPMEARVTEVQLFARPEDLNQPWPESRVSLDQDAGGAKFVDSSYERTHTETSKEVCVNFAHWNSDKAYTARILVRYSV